MSKTIRRIIFYALVLVFAVLGVGITLYAQGIRIDPKTLTFTNVGGMYIVPAPSTATMTLDGKPLKPNSGIFQKGTLVNGLFPKNHTLEISADGYKSWKRTISIEPSKVAEIAHAVLVPLAPFSQIGNNVTGFWLFQGSPLLQEQGKTYRFKDTLIPASSTPIGWSNNGFLTRTGTTYAFVNVLDAQSSSLKPIISKFGTEALASSTKIQLDPFNNGKLFMFTPHLLALGDISNASVSNIVKTTSTILTAFIASDDAIAWAEFSPASSTSRVSVYDRFSRKLKIVAETLSGKTKELTWGDGTLLGILQENGDLFVDETADIVKPSKQSTSVRVINFTSDGSKLAIIGTNSLEIVSFSDDDYARFNIADIDTLQYISWYRDNHNLFLTYPDRVVMLDIDDGHQENIVHIATTTLSAYDGGLNRFYYLENGVVQALQFPKD